MFWTIYKFGASVWKLFELHERDDQRRDATITAIYVDQTMLSTCATPVITPYLKVCLHKIKHAGQYEFFLFDFSKSIQASSEPSFYIEYIGLDIENVICFIFLYIKGWCLSLKITKLKQGKIEDKIKIYC